MFDPSVREEIAGFLRQILEEAGLLQSRLSELLEENNEGLYEESEVAYRVGNAVDNQMSKISSLKHGLYGILVSSISAAQQQMYWCQLPYNGPSSSTAHFDHNVFKCQSNTSHVFCSSHNLQSRLCPVCGGTLV